MTRLAALLAMFHACAALAGGTRDGPIAFDVTLAPQKLHEECVRLEAGEKRSYHWKANAPVDFNVHYHRGPEVFYPVKRDAMRGDGGTFVARTGEDYCWMWTARDKPAKIDGQIK